MIRIGRKWKKKKQKLYNDKRRFKHESTVTITRDESWSRARYKKKIKRYERNSEGRILLETLENGGQEILNENEEVDEDEEWTLKGKMENWYNT